MPRDGKGKCLIFRMPSVVPPALITLTETCPSLSKTLRSEAWCLRRLRLLCISLHKHLSSQGQSCSDVSCQLLVPLEEKLSELFFFLSRVFLNFCLSQDDFWWLSQVMQAVITGCIPSSSQCNTNTVKIRMWVMTVWAFICCSTIYISSENFVPLFLHSYDVKGYSK